ncbi:lipoate--protein ligase family protein [bacterium]|nr:lipoate--protein ligase family protein [bacterium]
MATLIDYKEYNGIDNMRIDSELLEDAVKKQEKEPILRFYGWVPACVSLGRNQTEEHINVSFCKENNIDIVKRVTGGRGLLHDDEVTYSFVCPCDYLDGGESIIKSYKEISSALMEGLKLLGIEAELGNKKQRSASFDYCMSLSTGADLCYKGKKIIGSAQYRHQNYILQHGSILFSYNKEIIEKIFNEKTDENSITCIKEINSSLTRKDIVEAMKKGFNSYFTSLYL